MDTIIHDAIFVTGHSETEVAYVRSIAIALGLPCSDLVASPVNGHRSFLIAPDGATEEASESDQGDEARAAWRAWMKHEWNNGSAYVRWVQLRYEDPEGRATDGAWASIAFAWPDRTARP